MLFMRSIQNTYVGSFVHYKDAGRVQTVQYYIFPAHAHKSAPRVPRP